MKRIFTFWEPRANVPGYLQLCLQTWRRFLPEFEIVLLDYGNLSDWLRPEDLDLVELKRYALAVQADAIRAALLARHGGIWLDLDTVLVSEACRCLLAVPDKFTLIGKHICAIAAPPNHPICQMWSSAVRNRLRFLRDLREARTLWARCGLALRHPQFYWRYGTGVAGWDYLGNAALKSALRRYRPLFNQLDRRELGAFPEMNFSPNAKVTPEGYRMCHFQQASVAIDPATVSGGIICLHNSWTPEEIRRMTIEEFIGQDLPLARLLRRTILR